MEESVNDVMSSRPENYNIFGVQHANDLSEDQHDVENWRVRHEHDDGVGRRHSDEHIPLVQRDEDRENRRKRNTRFLCILGCAIVAIIILLVVFLAAFLSPRSVTVQAVSSRYHR